MDKMKERDSDEVGYNHIYYPDQVKKFGVDLTAKPQAAEGGETE